MKNLSDEIKFAILSCMPYLEEVNSGAVKRMVNMIISVLVRNDLLTPDQGIENRIPYSERKLILDEPWDKFWNLLSVEPSKDYPKTYTISSSPLSLDLNDFSTSFEEYIDFTNVTPNPGDNRPEEK